MGFVWFRLFWTSVSSYVDTETKMMISGHPCPRQRLVVDPPGETSCVGQARVAPTALSSVLTETPPLFWAPACQAVVDCRNQEAAQESEKPLSGVHTGITKPVLSRWLEKCKHRAVEIQQTRYKAKPQKAGRDEFDDLCMESQTDIAKVDLCECHLRF